MKMKIFSKIFFISCFLISIAGGENYFNKGVNLSGWFQTNSPTEIHFTKYTKEDFENIKSLGADVIRLPINLHSMTNGAPNYELGPLFLRFLDEVIDWAEELEINLILDNHTFDPSSDTDPNIGDILIPVWKNMSEHFKNRTDYIFYEILNEPHGIDDVLWNEIQQNVIDAIRTNDSVHTIIVGPAGWNSYNNLKYMPEYEDDNLIYTFHFYDPFLFTHQGAGWTDPSLVPLAGVPFPYNSSRMPGFPSELEGTWVEYSFYNYQNEGTIGKVRELIDIAIQFKEERNVPVFCGEFGVLMDNAVNNDRILWYQVVRTYLEANDIAWTSWDYHGGFGLFEKNSNGLFDHDLNVNLLGALGFNIPPQTEFELKPDSTGFAIYSDYIETRIDGSSYSDGLINFNDENAYSGNYCLSWLNPAQYNHIGFNFVPVKDLSYLVDNNYHISFWFKCNYPLAKFDIRFIDTKENDEDHPWRMGITISNLNASFDGNWNYVQIPLLTLVELGSWDNGWYEPQELFDWSKVDRFEIVNEHASLNNTQIWFDDIKVFDPNSTFVDKEEYVVKEYKLHQNFPNPFNPSTSIRVSLPEKAEIKLAVYNTLGEKVEILFSGIKNAGEHLFKFGNNKLSSGVYFYVLQTGKIRLTKKMMYLK